MNIFHNIAEEVHRFYERTMRVPGFVIVGWSEWEVMGQEMSRKLEWLGHEVPAGRQLAAGVFVGTDFGMIEVRCDWGTYSVIAPVLKEML